MSLSKSLKTAELWDGARSVVHRARLSLVETIFLLAAVCFAVVVTFFYLTKIQPRNSQLGGLQQRSAAAKATLARLDKQARDRAEQQNHSEEILESLQKFEDRLKDPQQGKTQIIDELSQLTRANQVALGDVTFVVTAAEQTDAAGNPVQQVSRNDKNSGVYPALGMSTTVEGDYHNLRRFISDLERSKQFLVINALALQSVDQNSRRGGKRAVAPGPAGPAMVPGPGGPIPGPAQVRPQVQAPASGDALTVALKIEMDTFFQKRSTP